MTLLLVCLIIENVEQLMNKRVEYRRTNSSYIRPVATDFILVRPFLSTEGAKASAEGVKLC